MKVFVITLPDAKDRQENISSQLHSMDIPYEFIWGVNGKRMTPGEIAESYDSERAVKRLGRNLTPGEIGCALSHRLVYEKMIKANIERAIILEDDVIVDKDFIVVMNLLMNIRINNYIVKLDSPQKQMVPWHKIRLNDKYMIEHPLSSVMFTWGYYIDLIAAETMINISKKVFLVADDWFWYKSYIKIRMLNKNIIFSNDSLESEIGERSEGMEGQKFEYISKYPLLNKSVKSIRLLVSLFH
ncbi:MAG: glycosyltransferase family 25 protein [Treponema sp.]|nr:glycosyltransferase family 25 protein [Treponema sp.]